MPVVSFFVGIALLFAGGMLSGCLDLPSRPHSIKPIENVSITSFQLEKTDSTELKISPLFESTFHVNVTPKSYKDELEIEWFRSDNGKDSLLCSGDSIVISHLPTPSEIPNKVVLTDKANNKLEKEFTIIVNTAPTMGSLAKPDQGDTLYATPTTAIEFSWTSSDYDLSNGDKLNHTLEIDGVQYNVGQLNKVVQSGFKSGVHQFRVIVEDRYASADTLSMHKFFVVDTTGGEH